MRALARLGVKVEITELDVALPLVTGSRTGSPARPALYQARGRGLRARAACTGLTVWGIRDPDSWLDVYDVTKGNAPNRPLLLDGKGGASPPTAPWARG